MTRYLRTSQAGLYLDTLLCTGKTTDTAGNVFTLDAQAEGASWGAPVPIDVAVQRWMTDGAVASTQGHENREIQFRVKIAADTSAGLAAGEDALVTAARSASLLTWQPPEGSLYAASTVFEVWTAHLDHQFDVDEENRLTRAYLVTITAKPWARSATPVTVAAVPTSGAGTVTQIDACTVTTGWTGAPNAPTVVGGTAVNESNLFTTAGLWTMTLTRTGSVTGMGTTPYLALDLRAGGGSVAAWSVTVDGKGCTKVGNVGTTQYWKVPASVTSFTSLFIAAAFNVPANATAYLDVYDVSKTDTIGTTSSHKMFSRHLDVGGSVPTNGSIQIASPSATVLGNVLVYTCPDIGNGYSPAMRQFRTSGGTTTADATCVSGVHETLSTTVYYTVPAGMLRPGNYAVIARLIFPTAGSIKPTFYVVRTSGGTFVEIINPTVTTTGAATVWAALGVVSIPAFAKPVESAVNDFFGFARTIISGTGDQQLDEVLLLDITRGSVSLVLAGGASTTPAFTRLWLDAPDTDPIGNRPHIYTGTQADRSDALTPDPTQILSMGDHDLDPDGSFVFTVTDGVDDAVVTASFYRRWHTNAAS